MGRVKFSKKTAAEYAQLVSGGRIDPDTIYFETTNRLIYLNGECYTHGSSNAVQQENDS